MRKSLMVLGASLALSMGLSACTPFQRGETIVKYNIGESGRVGEALHDGEYALYSTTDTKPKIVLMLHKHDRLGFERSNDRIYYIAGDRREEAGSAEGNYYWNYRGDKR